MLRLLISLDDVKKSPISATKGKGFVFLLVEEKIFLVQLLRMRIIENVREIFHEFIGIN